jgi:hypothetical protein
MNVTNRCADCIHAVLVDMMIAVLLCEHYEGRSGVLYPGNHPWMRKKTSLLMQAFRLELDHPKYL